MEDSFCKLVLLELRRFQQGKYEEKEKKDLERMEGAEVYIDWARDKFRLAWFVRAVQGQEILV
jgi:hypothetical protein